MYTGSLNIESQSIVKNLIFHLIYIQYNLFSFLVVIYEGKVRTTYVPVLSILNIFITVG